MGKRKETEKFIIDWIYKITQSKKNVQLYENMFKDMNNDQFEKFINKLENGELVLQVIIPLDGFDGKVDLKRNYKLAKELGFEFFEHILMGPIDNGPDGKIPKYKTPNKYMVIDLPFRRTKQTLEKGLAVAESTREIDMLTGQVRNDDKVSSISFPELQVLVGMGLKDSLIELMRDRGGDLTSKTIMLNSLSKYGRISRKIVDLYAEGALSTKSLKNYLTGMHLKNTL
jgi:hypothetical protein